jgi:hypothetical protein
MRREGRAAHAPDVLPCAGHRFASRLDSPMDAPVDSAHPSWASRITRAIGGAIEEPPILGDLQHDYGRAA